MSFSSNRNYSNTSESVKFPHKFLRMIDGTTFKGEILRKIETSLSKSLTKYILQDQRSKSKARIFDEREDRFEALNIIDVYHIASEFEKLSDLSTHVECNNSIQNSLSLIHEIRDKMKRKDSFDRKILETIFDENLLASVDASKLTSNLQNHNNKSNKILSQTAVDELHNVINDLESFNKSKKIDFLDKKIKKIRKFLRKKC